jgi:hypothetical protein
LASIEFRSGQIPTGKKAQAEEASRLAGYGTAWWGLLHDQDSPTFDPNGLTPEDRVKWDARQAKRRQESAASTPAQEPTRRTIDDVISERNARLSQDDWGDDLRFDPTPFSVPGERNPPPDHDE